jgi:hypothetical protein
MRTAASIARSGRARGSARAARLHDHDRHRVADEVVHLARDAPALVGDRRGGGLLAALLGAARRLVQLGGQQRPRVDRARARPHGDEEAAREQVVADDRLGLVRLTATRPAKVTAMPASDARSAGVKPAMTADHMSRTNGHSRL